MGIITALKKIFTPDDRKSSYPKCYSMYLKCYNDDGTKRTDGQTKVNELDAAISIEVSHLREFGFDNKPIGTKYYVINCSGDKMPVYYSVEHHLWIFQTINVMFHDIARIALWDNLCGVTVFCKNGVVFKKKIPDAPGLIAAFEEFKKIAPKETVNVW